MLIDSFVNERLDWPLAAAASIALLAMAARRDRSRAAASCRSRRWRRRADARRDLASTSSRPSSRRSWSCRSSPSCRSPSASRASCGCRPTRGRLRWWSGLLRRPVLAAGAADQPAGGVPVEPARGRGRHRRGARPRAAARLAPEARDGLLHRPGGRAGDRARGRPLRDRPRVRARRHRDRPRARPHDAGPALRRAERRRLLAALDPRLGARGRRASARGRRGSSAP